MTEELKASKVFISYSWSSPQHEEWVYELASRLESNGVEVVFDKWDSVEGHNLNAFMQRSVNDPSISKVLVICDETYKQKADGFEGGVGTETVIISNEVYKSVEQTKFIPIVSQRGPAGEEYIPTYLSGTKYIDMSSAQKYEDGYEKVLRNLYGKPEFERPKRGSAPAYLLRDEKKTTLESRRALNRFRHDVEKKPRNIDIYFNEFVETFKIDLKSFSITPDQKDDRVQLMLESLHDTIELRDVFIEFLETYIKEAEVVNESLIIDLFESIYPIIYTKSNTHAYYEDQFDHMKFFVTELMIYNIAQLYRYKKFEVIKSVVTNHYFVTSRLERQLDGSIGLFCEYPRLLDEIKLPSTDQKYISNRGKLIIDRANYEGIKADDLIQADFIIYLLSFAHDKLEEFYTWYPPTYPYFSASRIQFLNKIKSKRFFESVKAIFPEANEDERRKMFGDFNVYLREAKSGSSMYFNLSINPDDIAKL
ncbi:SEFIR domain-containing protein [Psychrobacillus sp. NPDC096426]|uniref:SEFIR domain-containing protein n=1 Tax=Psychrobacillus sp. NPDC096426 TaxID=3364491 RepID=UPI0037F8F5CB